MEEKQLISDLISNYEELKRIVRKTEYEIYIGGLKSKLDNLYLKRMLIESAGNIPNVLLFKYSFSGSTGHFQRKIDELEKELKNAERTVKVSEDITDKVISIFKIYLSCEKIEVQDEIVQTNKLIMENIVQILEKSINYKMGIIDNLIKKGRIYLAQMKDSEKEYDMVKNELELILKENNLNSKIIKLESIFDKTLNVIYDANLSIKDSKWLRMITYFTLLIAIIGIVIALIQFSII